MLAYYLSIIAEQEERDIFISLYNDYRGVMFSIANDILNDPHESENIVHDSFVLIIDNLGKFRLDNEYKTKGLVCIIVSRLAISEYRRKKRLDLIDDFESDENNYAPCATEDHVIGQEQYELLKSAIKSLSDIYADTLILKYDFHYSNKEIAELMSVSEDTVRQRIYRAKCQLRELLARKGSLHDK